MARKRKRKINLRKVFLLLLILGLVIFGAIFIIKNKKQGETKQIEVIDSIDNFGYELNDNETKYYNELFDSLKNLLKNENYDEKEYATLIAKLFLTDFYDLNNKIMKSDIGGTQFVYEPYRQDFETGAMNTVYKYVESNVYGDRKQELPTVKEVSIESINTDTFKYNDIVDDKSYYITMNINYTKNLEYPSKVDLILIHNNNRLEIAKLETKD